MKKLLLLITLLGNLIPLPVLARAGISYSNNTVRVNFPTSMTFNITLESAAPITDIRLIYGTNEDTCGTVEAVAYPDFTPGSSMTVSWTWDMQRSGSLPTGSMIWWRWEGMDSAGNTLRVPREEQIWLDAIHDWQSIRSGQIALHWYSGEMAYAQELLDHSVLSMDLVQERIGLQPSGLINIYVYADGSDMRDAILYESGWTGGMAFSNHNIVLIGINPAEIEWGKRAIAHEITHILVGDATFTCIGGVPTWLAEGIAVFGEGGLDDASQRQFDRAVKENTLLSAETLSGTFSEDPDKAGLSYSQSFSMVNYLIQEYGRDQLNLLFQTLTQGVLIDPAMREVYGFDLNEFEQRWRGSIGAAPPVPVVDKSLQPTPVPTLPLAVPVMATPFSPIPESVLTAIPNSPGSTDGNPPNQSNTDLGYRIILIALGSCILLLVVLVIVIILLRRRRKLPSGPAAPIAAFIFVSLGMGYLLWAPRSVSAQTGKSTPTYAPFPTATAVTSRSISLDHNRFMDPEGGLEITLDDNWLMTLLEPGSNDLLMFDDENAAIRGILSAYPNYHDLELKEVSLQMRDGLTEGMLDLVIKEDKAITLNKGIPAWYFMFDGTYQNPAIRDEAFPFRVIHSVFQTDSKIYYFLIFGPPENLTNHNAEIQAVINAPAMSPASALSETDSNILLLTGGESGNPRDYDPATLHSAGDSLVFAGLVTFGPDGALVGDLAQSLDVNPDGTIFTFHLHPDAVFHNGKPVTSRDIIYSWERAADPATNSDTVLTYLGDIVGVKEMVEGKTNHIRGLKPLDDHTLQVTIDAPKPYFLMKLTYPTAFVVDQANVEQGEDWYRTPNGTGPFRLIRWEKDKVMLYERFDDYYGIPPGIRSIVYQLYVNDDVSMYETGSNHIASVPYYNVDRVLDPEGPFINEVVTGVNMCTDYTVFDVTQPPFDDPLVRRAFSLAFDRQRFVDGVSYGKALPAHGLYPPGMPAYNAQRNGIEFNPQEAQALLASSKYASNMPEIVFLSAGFGSGVSSSVAAQAQLWEQNLGVSITIRNIAPDQYYDRLFSGENGQLVSTGWCADYPDPENFADILFHSGSAQNHGHYSNPELDVLLEKARVESSAEQRIRLYQQAEELILQDSPAVFITHDMSYVLVKPFVKGYILSPIATYPALRYLWIEP